MYRENSLSFTYSITIILLKYMPYKDDCVSAYIFYSYLVGVNAVNVL